MKTIIITKSHPFFKDVDKKALTENLPNHVGFDQFIEYVKEWYNLTNIVIDYAGTKAEITMSDPQYTLWVMKWQ